MHLADVCGHASGLVAAADVEQAHPAIKQGWLTVFQESQCVCQAAQHHCMRLVLRVICFITQQSRHWDMSHGTAYQQVRSIALEPSVFFILALRHPCLLLLPSNICTCIYVTFQVQFSAADCVPAL